MSLPPVYDAKCLKKAMKVCNEWTTDLFARSKATYPIKSRITQWFFSLVQWFHFLYLIYGDREQNRKGEIEGPHWETLKTWVPHKECCIQSLRENLQGQWKGQKMSPQGCKKGNVCTCSNNFTPDMNQQISSRQWGTERLGEPSWFEDITRFKQASFSGVFMGVRMGWWYMLQIPYYKGFFFFTSVILNETFTPHFSYCKISWTSHWFTSIIIWGFCQLITYIHINPFPRIIYILFGSDQKKYVNKRIAHNETRFEMPILKVTWKWYFLKIKLLSQKYVFLWEECE